MPNGRYARKSSVGAALVLAGLSMCLSHAARAEDPRPVRTVVVQIASDVDPSNATLARVIELLTPLGVFVSAGDVAEHDDGAVIARITVTRVDPQQLQIAISGAHDEQLTRALPLPSRRVDEAAREAVATVCASNVQALLEAEPPTAAAVVPADNAAPAPSAAPPLEAPITPQAAAPAPVSPPRPAAASEAEHLRVLDREVPPRAPPRDPRDQLGFGYELFAWGGGRLLNGPRLHASYAALQSGSMSLGLGAELAFSLPSSARERFFDLALTTGSLRVLVEPALQLTKRWTLSLPLGPQLEIVSAKSSGASSSVALSAAHVRFAYALVLRPTVTLTLSRSWSLALGGGLELSPMQIRYGVSHPDGFTTVLASSYAKPTLCLDLAFHT